MLFLEEPGQGNSWRLISHELDEEDAEDESEKDEPDITTKPIAKVSFQRSHIAAVPPPAHGNKSCKLKDVSIVMLSKLDL